MTRRIFSLLLLLLAAPLLFGASNANNSRGFNADAVYDIHEVDSINPFSGSVNLRIPIGGTYTAGDRLQYGFTLTYNSAIWDLEKRRDGGLTRTEAVPARLSNAGIGFMVTLGELFYHDGLVYVAPDGSEHSLRAAQVHFGADSNTNQTTLYSRGNDYLRLRSADTVDSVVRIVDFPDGSSKEFVCIAQCSPFRNEETKFYLTRIRDQFENEITIERDPEPQGYQAAGTTWEWRVLEKSEGGRSTEHRIIWGFYGHEPYRWTIGKIQVEVSTPSFQPDQTIVQRRWAEYDFEYFLNEEGRAYRPGEHTATRAMTTIQRDDAQIWVPVLKSVKLPDDSRWEFQYKQPSPIAPNASLGRPYWTAFADRMIERVTYPTGGGVKYEWGSYLYPRRSCYNPTERDSIPRASTSTGARVRQLLKPNGDPEGKPWRYLTSHLGGPAQPGFPYVCSGAHTFVSTVVDPLATVTQTFFSIIISADSGIAGASPEDYGMAVAPATPDPQGGGRRLSTKTFKCSTTDYFDPAITPQNEISSYTTGPEQVCGTAKREIYVRYDSSGTSCDWSDSDNGPGCVSANRRLASERVVYKDDGDSSRLTENLNFDGLGHFRETQISGDFFQKNGLPAGNPARPRGDLKVLTTRWNNDVTFTMNPDAFSGYPQPADRWILEKYDRKTEEDRGTGGAPAGKGGIVTTEFYFDELGFLTQKRVLAGASRGGTDLLTTWTRTVDEASSRVKIAERYSGGDGEQLSLADLPIDSGSADYAIDATYRFGALERREYKTCDGSVTILLIERNEIDPATGLVLSTRDAAGAITSFLFDEMNRMTEIHPPGSQSGSAAVSNITYTRSVSGSPATAVVVQDNGTNKKPESRYEYDPFGRLSATLKRLPDGTFNRTEVSYYETGWKKEETTTRPDGAVAAGKTQYTSYDAFGRLTEQLHADNGENSRERKTNWTYSGDRSVQMIITGVAIGAAQSGSSTVTNLYDSQLRLAAVTENSAGLQQTIYEYDSANRLYKVHAGNQTRTFDYDNRGFLRREYAPELGSYGIRYDGHDALGHLKDTYHQASGRHDLDLTYTWDGAERLTLVAQPKYRIDNKARPLKSFAYYLNPASGAHLLGKLRETTRHNYVYDPRAVTSPKDIAVTERYNYWSTNHRLRYTRVISEGLKWETTFNYDTLGNVSSVQYPSMTVGCTVSATCPAEGPARTVSDNYTYGFLTAVPGFISSISYHPNEMVASVAHTNGVTWIQEMPDRNQVRPKVIRLSGTSNGQNWNTGTYQYDAVGNIYKIDQDSFTYDAVGRLTSATTANGSQSFSYDRHGNQTGFGSNLIPDGTTNRLPSSVATYDDGGNVITYKDPRQTKYEYRYEFDPFNLLRHSTAFEGNRQALGRMFLYNAHDERIAMIDYITAKPRVVETWSARDTGNRVIRDFTRNYEPGVTPAGGRSASARGWSWTRDYVFRGTALAATVDISGTTHTHVDHLGSVRVTTNSSGAANPIRTFRPFGEEVVSTPDPLRLKFTGHERDDAGADLQYGDVDYMHARYYNPLLGRFLSPDPGGDHDPRVPQSWNRYAYVRNSPMGRTDPDGRKGNLHEAGTDKMANNPCTGGDSGGTGGGCVQTAQDNREEQERAAARQRIRNTKEANASQPMPGLNREGETTPAVEMLMDQKTGMVYPQLPPTDAEATGGTFFVGVGEGGLHGDMVEDVSLLVNGKRKFDLVDRDTKVYRAGHLLGGVIDAVVGAKYADVVVVWFDKVFK